MAKGPGRNRNPDAEAGTNENGARKRRERLGQSMLTEAGGVGSLRIVPGGGADGSHFIPGDADDDDDDEPPPLR